MAYTVGSASVDIIPDFKNAQLAITAFFQKQKDGIKIPVKLDVEQGGSGNVEQQARVVGSRVGKAMADAREHELEKAHAQALRVNAQRDEAAIRRAGQTASRIAEAERKARDQSAADAARQREIDLRLEERIFQESIKRQIAAMKAAQRDASREEKIRLQVEIDQQQAILAGRQAGGLIARSIRHEVRQNAGLIAGVIAGALIAGAPLAIGGAVALFGGIGAVAAAQSERVRSAYVGLWSDIKAGAISDSQSLVPVFERTAGQIGQSFQRMRPLIRDAFEASGAHVQSFTGSVLQAAENALPGLTRAVIAAGPAVSGLGALAEKSGTGVGRFFEVLSTHSASAGRAASSLGDAIEALLPALAELLGQGAETAAVVLPVIASGFRGLNTVLDATGGILPSVLTAFLAFRAVQGVGRVFQNWTADLGMASISGGRFAGVAGRAAGAVSAMGKALPGVGLVAALFGVAMANSAQQVNDWADALNAGGDAARRAREEMSKQTQELDSNAGRLNSFVSQFTAAGAIVKDYGNNVDEANKAHQEYIRNLTPLEKAQRDVDVATRALQKGMEDEGTSASELTRLKAAVAAAAARQAAEEAKLERATRGVTEAMTAQAEAARARIDSAYGYQKALLDQQQAVLDVTEAETALADARAEGDPAAIAQAELDYKNALLGVNDALSNRVKLASEVAVSKLPAAMDEDQKAILGAKAALEELNKIIAEGTTLDPDMEAYRQSLINITGQADGAMLRQAQLAAALREVGIAVTEIPGTASVTISDNSPEVIAKLESLGFQVTTLPNGEVKVTPVTQAAQAALGNLSTHLAELDSTTATPIVTANPAPFNGTAAEVARRLKLLGETSPAPIIRAQDFAGAVISGVQAKLNGLQDKTVTITTVQRNVTVPGSSIRSTVGPHTGGAIEDHLAKNPRVKYWTGGAVKYGRGGPWDDLVDAKLSPGEHVLDFGDVQAMGGQDAVYDFRRMLHDGYFNKPGPDNAIRSMVTTGAAPRKPDAPVQSTRTPRSVALYTPDIPAAMRALKAQEHEEAALAPVW